MKNTYRESFVLRRTVVAVEAALLAMFTAQSAQAQDQTVAELTTPDKTVEVGAIYTNKDSYKFGEYNGLQSKGLHGVLNFDLTGKGDDDSTTWWSVRGADLGLDSRRVEATGGNQGKFNLQFLYDELPHRYSDSYKTIFNGAGSTGLTLPASYPAVGTRVSSTTSDANALANWANIQAPNAVSGTAGGGPGYLIPSLMHNENIGTKRTKLGGGGSYFVTPQWELSASVFQDDKKGTKLTGFAFASASTAAMLVEPINFKTTAYNLAAGYKGDKANFKLAYSYSKFQNNVNGWTAATPFAGGSVINNQALLSSAPDNEMHQVNASGGYRFSPTTRISYEVIRSQMAQDDSFNCQSGTTAGCITQGTWIIPGASANAKVVTDTAFIKLTSRPLSQLNLNASYKFDRRDNQTPVRTYTVAFADSSGGTSPITNDPINSTKNRINLDADYAVAQAQAIKLGYQRENISRSTEGNGFAPSRTQTTANTNDFSLPTHRTTEDSLTLEYRNSIVPDLTGRIAFTEAKRNAKDFANPTLTDTTASLAITNPYYRSFRDFFIADRTQEKLRGALNYQVNDKLGLGFTVDHNHDKYDDAALKDVKSSIFNFDLTYAPTDNFVVNPYYSYEDRKTTLNGKYITLSTANALLNGVAQTCSVAVPCQLINTDWTLAQADKVNTLGLGLKYKGFLSGKLETSGDVLYIHSKTPVTASGGGSLVSDGAATPNYTSLAAMSFPDITSKTWQLRLTGNYKVDKAQTVRVTYMYQRLTSSDWQYDAYNNPVAMQAYIGTGMVSPNYTVNAIGVSYLYNFK
ncbi:MAG TPA: MtrB/PioB family decaheme-associated outer membrane protein [Rhodocyclaceae bacterium]|nr:MtrB/PioB family decaheme-associated outer membrane protein [Rhodocyclaceae bacterium]